MYTGLSAHLSKILILFLTLGSCIAYGQEGITVSGRITTEDGSTLPGVSVIEKGTQNGTISDIDGRYRITVSSDAVLVFMFIGFEAKEVKVEGVSKLDILLEEDVITHWPVVNIGYGYTTSNLSVGANGRLTDHNFNNGTIYDPTQLWQGRVAGLSVYKRGSDPNFESIMRIRGLSTFDVDATPLIVIDGVPMATMHNLDPQDIESIDVLKDGSAAAIFGMRASQGVILITTRQGSPAKGLAVIAHSEGAASTLSKKQPVMDAEEHIANGGNDLGSSTDWQDEITHTGISTAHHVTISGANSTSSFRAATHIRHVEGILLHSGFDQVNTRVNLKHRALSDRLRFNFNLAVTNRKSNFSFTQAFRYANLFLPSAPVYFSNGNYYQAILFDNYNPVALLEQNINLGKRRNTNYGATIDFDILESLTATVNAAQQFESNFNGKYYSRNSLFVGQSRDGLAQRYTDDRSFTLAEGYLTFSKLGKELGFNLVAGFSYQEDQSESFGAELGNFPNDELGYNAIGYSADILSGQPNLIDIFSTTSPVNTIKAGFLRARMNIYEAMTISMSVRRESSNKLGVNKQSGLFPAVGVNLNVLHYFPLDLSQLNVRLGYGVTGSIPTQPGLAVDKFEYYLDGGGTLSKVRDGNPDLQWEQKKEINVGFDFGKNRFYGSIDFYQRKISDIIQQVYADQQVYPSGIRYENVGGLKGRGLELMLSYYAGNYGEFIWQPSLVVSTNRTLVDAYKVDKEVRGYVGTPGFGSTQMIKIEVGEKVGNIWGPVFEGVGTNGMPVFKDVNGDGQLLADPGDALDPMTDFTSLGNAIPTWEFGWNNRFVFRNWELNAFLRGAFGHSLVNILRLGYETVDAGAINSYNRVKTDKAVDGLAYGPYSSLYVEKASFVKLDNITLTYSLPIKADHWLQSLRISGTVQNAFTITSYTGPDPEPSVIDYLPGSFFSVEPDPLAPGIDRNSSYAPARTFTVGLSVGI